MVEDYFLYIEYLDWGLRRWRHRIGFATKAVIRHIGGTAIGSAVDIKKRSPLSIPLFGPERDTLRARVRGMALDLPLRVGRIARYVMKGSPRAARMTFAGLVDGVKGNREDLMFRSVCRVRANKLQLGRD